MMPDMGAVAGSWEAVGQPEEGADGAPVVEGVRGVGAGAQSERGRRGKQNRGEGFGGHEAPLECDRRVSNVVR